MTPMLSAVHLGATAAPAEAATTRYLAVVTGFDYSCALTSRGAVYCWGYNDRGQLGDDSSDDTYGPVAVAD